MCGELWGEEGAKRGKGRKLATLERAWPLKRVSKTHQVVDQSSGGVLQHMGEEYTAALAFVFLLLHPTPTQCRSCLGIGTRRN